jgi:molybdopterin-guanine dinucleotide biosynthesis protein A
VVSGVTDRDPVAAAILAGGRARRFGGRDKSRLVVGGRTIIVRQLEVLQQLTSDVFVVGPADGRFDDLGVRVYPDRIPDAGALGGLYTALDAATTERVLVVACDLPFLDAKVLARLVALADGHDAAWIRTARGPEPLVACYQRTIRARIADRLARDERRIADLEQELDIAWLEGEELSRIGARADFLANLNSPDDYARVQ